MKYVGSKGRHAKQILPIILANRKPGQAYVEPFVGGANTLQHVDGWRIAGDLHGPLITMWKAVALGWMPKADELTEAHYEAAKAIKGDDGLPPIVTFMGFTQSFGAKWFGGYARGKKADGSPRDYADESIRNASEQFPKLSGVEFHNVGYQNLEVPDGSIVYCDPPYAESLGYSTGGFDHAAFWEWCRDMVALGHSVFVSEYAAPEDFVCVWSKGVTVSIDSGRKEAPKRVERLFVHKSQAPDA